MTVPTSREARFVAFLRQLAVKEEHGALAALRRTLGRAPGEAAEAFPYVVPWVPTDSSRRVEDAYYLVAGLFAWHQLDWPTPDGGRGANNLGASFRRLAGQDRHEAVERRFVALLNSHAEELPERLRQAVGLLRSADVPIDWTSLLRDLQRWDREDRPVQRAWARAFWAQPRADTEHPVLEAASPASVTTVEE